MRARQNINEHIYEMKKKEEHRKKHRIFGRFDKHKC